MEEEWFRRPEWWFSAGARADAEIAGRYFSLLDRCDHEGIEAALVWDQLPRHAFRGQPCAHVIDWFLRKALAARVDFEALDDERFCFALLPLRHAGRWREALEQAWARVEARGEASAALRRFLKASYERAPREAGDWVLPPDGYDKSILESAPRGPPVEGERLEALAGSRLVLSLSGGVDSMLCGWMLRGKLSATVHVNYCNRDTSDLEAELCAWWSWRVLGVPCMVRRISEIRRAQCMSVGLRETYEKYTRDARYECYKAFGSDALIVLGHNRDDAIENIFTNIAKGCASLENLRGMKWRSRSDSVEFWRPLLALSKAEIYDKARAMRVPYLPSSTPSWSMRGKIRACVVPALDAWNPGFVEGLWALSGIVEELSGAIDDRARCDEVSDSDAVLAIFWRRWLDARGLRASSKAISNLCDRLCCAKNRARVVLSKTLTLEVERRENGWRLAAFNAS